MQGINIIVYAKAASSKLIQNSNHSQWWRWHCAGSVQLAYVLRAKWDPIHRPCRGHPLTRTDTHTHTPRNQYWKQKQMLPVSKTHTHTHRQGRKSRNNLESELMKSENVLLAAFRNSVRVVSSLRVLAQEAAEAAKAAPFCQIFVVILMNNEYIKYISRTVILLFDDTVGDFTFRNQINVFCIVY